MRSSSGFSLIQVMVAMVLMAIIATAVIPDLRDAVFGSQKTVVHQQAGKCQEFLDAWVVAQKSLASAASKFSAGPSNTLVPNDLQAIVDEINALMETDKVVFQVDGGRIVTEAMRNMGAHIEITWPQPYRHNHPRANLFIP